VDSGNVAAMHERKKAVKPASVRKRTWRAKHTAEERGERNRKESAARNLARRKDRVVSCALLHLCMELPCALVR
jgi:hypothetical protein